MTYEDASCSRDSLGSTRLLLLGGSLLAAAALAACYTGGSATEVGAGPNGTIAETSANQAIPGDLPCDVAQVLSDSCASCHGVPLAGGAPNRLVSYDDLIAPAMSDPSKKTIEYSIARMKDTQKPMPTTGPASAAQIAILEQWVASGLPKGTCGGSAASFGTASVCTSNQFSQVDEGSSMAPGQACIACHSREREGPRFSFAGTVYPTAHEPDDCIGVNGSTAGATVVITGADGATKIIRVNAAGNFSTSALIAMPYTAKVVVGGKERAMVTPQTNGDCNTCHSESGTSNAPGRVVSP